MLELNKVYCMDVTKQMPFKDNIFDAIVLDPPYAYDQPSKDDKHSEDFGQEFWRSREYLNTLHSHLNKECFNLLKPGGILIIKGCDLWDRESGFKDYFFVYEMLKTYKKFVPIDLFIYVYYNPRLAVHRGRFKYRYASLSKHTYFLVLWKQGDLERYHQQRLEDRIHKNRLADLAEELKCTSL